MKHCSLHSILIVAAGFVMCSIGGCVTIVGMVYLINQMFWCLVALDKWRREKTRLQLREQAFQAITRIEQHQSDLEDVYIVRQALSRNVMEYTDILRARSVAYPDEWPRRSIECVYFSFNYYLPCAIHPLREGCKGCQDYREK